MLEGLLSSHSASPLQHWTVLHDITLFTDYFSPMLFLLILPAALHPKSQPFAQLWSLQTHKQCGKEINTHLNRLKKKKTMLHNVLC